MVVDEKFIYFVDDKRNMMEVVKVMSEGNNKHWTIRNIEKALEDLRRWMEKQGYQVGNMEIVRRWWDICLKGKRIRIGIRNAGFSVHDEDYEKIMKKIKKLIKERLSKSKKKVYDLVYHIATYRASGFYIFERKIDGDE